MGRKIGEARRRAAGLRSVRGTGWLFAAAAVASLTWVVLKLLFDPRYVFLSPFAPGVWIAPDVRPDLVAEDGWQVVEVEYRKPFELDRAVAEWRIEFVALSGATVALDGKVLVDELEFDEPADAGGPQETTPGSWKRRRSFRSTSRLEPGPHELRAHVANVNGPALISLASAELGIATGPDWDCRGPDQAWGPTRRADAPFRLPNVSLCHPTVGEAFSDTAFCWILIALIAGTATWSFDAVRFAPGPEAPSRARRIVAAVASPAGLRWLLLALWLVRGANNLEAIPYNYGFDLRGHMDYVVHMADKKRVPFANEGWQGFQPPLFYALAVGLGKVFVPHSDLTTLTKFLRVVPLVCGLVQIELCYRVLRSAFPARRLLQCAGLATAALLPMHAAISQFLGNEPLAGCLTAVCVWQVFLIVREPRRASSVGQLALLGTFAGLSLLTKVSLFALLPVVGFYVTWSALRDPSAQVEASPDDAGRRNENSSATKPTEPTPQQKPVARTTSKTETPAGAHSALFGAVDAGAHVPVEEPLPRGRRVLRSILVWPAVALVVCGWYFVRNWYHLGKPFFGGWDPERGIVWWQVPGYRTVWDLATFGRVLSRPIYVTLGSLWDGLYSTLWMDGMLSGKGGFSHRPPWNIDLHLSLAALSLVPTLFLLVGLVRGARSLLKGESGPVAVAAALLLALLGAMFVLYLKLPVYSTVKASYTLGLLPAYAVLFAAGIEPFARTRLGRAATVGLLAAWASCAYAAFFVVERLPSPP